MAETSPPARFSLSGPTLPPYTAADAALCSALQNGNFAYAAEMFASVLWSWRDISSMRRRLAEAAADRIDPAALAALFELLDALPMLEIALAPQRQGLVLYEALTDVLATLTSAAKFDDGSSAWWLVQYCHAAHRRALVLGASPPPLVEWLYEVEPAVGLLHDHRTRTTANSLAWQLHVSPLVLAELACAIDLYKAAPLDPRSTC
jgi:hypothetical protein